MAFWKFSKKWVRELYYYSTEVIEADSMEEAIEKFWDTDLEYEYDQDYEDTFYSVIEVGEDGDEIGDEYEAF